jgi:hypothetical protein
MELFDGKIVSQDEPASLFSGGESIRNHRVVERSIGPRICNIRTDAGKLYELIVCGYVINSENKDLKGVCTIDIIEYDASVEDTDKLAAVEMEIARCEIGEWYRE